MQGKEKGYNRGIESKTRVGARARPNERISTVTTHSIPQKQCSKCGRVLPADTAHFYKHAQGKMGLHSSCIECKNQQARQHYQNNPDVRRRIAERTAAYAETEKGKEVHKKAIENSRNRHSDRWKARDAVKIARRQGKLPAPSTLLCAYCGQPAIEYHHHKGYSCEHWLDVIPLCHNCHTKAHLK